MIKKAPQKIIVRFPNWIGDFVMALPIIEDLKKQYPTSHITILLKKHLLELLKDQKDVDEIITLEKDTTLKLKEKGFDLGILLTNSFSSAYMFYKAKIKVRIGYKKDLRSFLLNKALKFPKEKIHQVLKYKKLLDPLNISSSKPKLSVSDVEIEKMKNLLKGFAVQEKDKVIVINAFAAFGDAKCWPLDRYEKLAKKLLKNSNNKIVFIGDKSVDKIIEPICSRLNVINLAGKTTLRELLAILKICVLFITNDSGPMHLASSLNTSLIAIFGSTSEILTGPYNNEIIINKNVSCSPCFKRKCPIDFKCMKQIRVEEVLNIANRLLKKC